MPSTKLTSVILLSLAGWGLAQAPAASPVTILPSYTPGSDLYYTATIHSTIPDTAQGTQATLDVSAEVKMHILPGATPGHFEAEMSFTKFHTSVASPTTADQTALQQEASATDQAAQTMAPARFQVGLGTFAVEVRPKGDEFDQPVEMLAEIARTDALPVGPVAVGAHWSHVSARPIAKMNFSIPLTLECSLTGLGTSAGAPSATISVHSQGQATLPAGSLPGADQLAAQGLVAEPTVAFSTDASSQYRLSDGVLLASTSHSDNQLHIKLVGPSPDAQTINTDIQSSGSVKLERVLNGKP